MTGDADTYICSTGQVQSLEYLEFQEAMNRKWMSSPSTLPTRLAKRR